MSHLPLPEPFSTPRRRALQLRLFPVLACLLAGAAAFAAKPPSGSAAPAGSEPGAQQRWIEAAAADAQLAEAYLAFLRAKDRQEMFELADALDTPEGMAATGALLGARNALNAAMRDSLAAHGQEPAKED